MEQKSTFWKSAMIYGLYIGIFFTFYSVLLYATGQTTNKALGYISFPLYALAIVLVQFHYRNTERNGIISYGEAVGIAAAAMLFSGVISALYTLILYSFIDPGLIQQMKTLQEEALVQKGMSEDQVEAAMSITSKMMTPGWMSIMGLFGSVFIGTIISLVSSIFVKKLPSEDAFDEAMEDVKTEE
jgi:hypothetical protein